MASSTPNLAVGLPSRRGDDGAARGGGPEDAASAETDAPTKAAPPPARRPFPQKIALTTICLAAFLALPYAHPALSRLRLFDKKAPVMAEVVAPAPIASVGEVSVPGPTDDTEARLQAAAAAAPVDARSPMAKAAPEPVKAPKAAPGAEGKAPRSIEDPSGHALDAFFAKLTRVEKKEPGAVARILYYGDSIVASDLITGKIRRLMQSRFGDAGHGYALIANAWPGWFHIDVSRKASETWKVSRLLGPYAADGFYGLGGASFTAEKPDAWTRFATVEGEWGSAVSRFEIEYLAQPGGGDVALLVDGQPSGTLATAAESPRLATHTIKVPDGPHSLEVRTTDTRPVRLFGIRMERDVPGVTVSALGLTGARARFLSKSNDAHWSEALRAANPDLVVLAFGSNEVADGLMYPLAEYEKTLTIVVKQVRAALPKASLMLVGPPDMASATEPSHSRTVTPLIAGVQRKVAAAEGWAFWDQYAAMGSAGSMWAWIKMGMGNPDMFHPTASGGNQLGTWEYRALMDLYEKSPR
jgi:lysophospholipase L1-like esterase